MGSSGLRLGRSSSFSLALGAAGLFFALLLLLPSASAVRAQESPERPTAGALFEEVRAREGFEQALVRLEEVLADTSSAYEVEPYELLRRIPARLVLEHRRDEAARLLRIQAGRFGDSPFYWVELGNAYLRCGNREETRAALEKAREMEPERPDLPWMLDHLDALLETVALQVAREDTLTPGGRTGLQGPYLGQTPPGPVPEVFAPGIVSTTAHEYHISFTPDGREIYFSRGGVGTLVSRWREEGWTGPEFVELLDPDHLTEEANVLPDGSGIVFCARAGLRSHRVLYKATRGEDGWTDPQRLFPGMYATATLEGTLYYTDRGEGRDYGAIVKRRWTGAGYGEPELVDGPGIQSEFPDAHPFIAPDENLLLFDSYRRPGEGIYASRKGSDGSWAPAVLLNERLGIPPVGQCALSPDGRYLFFCLVGDLYWVDARFLEDLEGE